MAPDDTRRPDPRRTDDDSPTGRPGVPPADLDRTEARQGETSGHMRWVLGAGLALVVAMFVLAFVIA
jgi:hypothetical protein